MKTTITEQNFIDAFYDYGRGNNFSREGLEQLFEFLEELEESTGEEMELDVIAICCDFTEYDSLEEFQSEHGEGFASIEDIEYETLVIAGSDGRFIIQNF